jgi:hypothetical protein
MKTLDDELRGAVRRVDPPQGFADRVRQRIHGERRLPRHQPSRATGAVRWALAATLVVAAGSGLWYRAERTEQRRMQGEEAKRQVLLSLSLAGSKLKTIEMKVNRGEER